MSKDPLEMGRGRGAVSATARQQDTILARLAFDPALCAGGVAIIVLVAFAVTMLGVDRLNPFTGLTLAHGAIYVAAIVWVLRCQPRPRDLALILLVALVVRAIAITAPPALTTDAFRYVWDGRIQWAGFNPYLFVPSDPALAHLRDGAIYPNVHLKDVAVTIYPPFAEMLFMAANAISDSLWGPKVVMAAFEGLTIWALIVWLGAAGMARERVLIYAWHPLPIWEFTSMAHIDAAATGLLVIAVLAAVQRRQGLAGALLGLAVLTKYFPIALIPAIWRRWDWRMPAAFVVTVGLLYVPYVAGAGTSVFGFLGRHLDNEGYISGYGFHVIWLLRDFSLADPPGKVWVAIAMATLAAIGLYTFVARRADEIKPAHLVLIAAAFVWLTSPHYPWYFGWIVPLLVLHLSPAALAMTLLCLLQNLRLPDASWYSAWYLLTFGLPLIVGAVSWAAARRLRPPSADVRS